MSIKRAVTDADLDEIVSSLLVESSTKSYSHSNPEDIYSPSKFSSLPQPVWSNTGSWNAWYAALSCILAASCGLLVVVWFKYRSTIAAAISTPQDSVLFPSKAMKKA